MGWSASSLIAQSRALSFRFTLNSGTVARPTGLNEIPGFGCLKPSGAFYVFPNVSGTGLSGSELAGRLLDEEGISVLSGTAFGRVGRDHIRISYANSQANIRTALGRIRTLAEKLIPAAGVSGATGSRAPSR